VGNRQKTVLASCNLVGGNGVRAEKFVKPGADDAVALVIVETSNKCLT